MAAIAATFGHRGTAICANGALAYDMRTEAIEARHLIPPPVLAAAAAALRAAVPGIGIAVEYPDGHAADPVYQAVNWDVNSSMPRLDDAALFARPASKLLGRHFGYTCDDLLALALPALDGLVSVTHSNAKGLIEASALGVSKASVVAEIAAGTGSAANRSSRSATCPTTCRCWPGRAPPARSPTPIPPCSPPPPTSSAATTRTAWPRTWRAVRLYAVQAGSVLAGGAEAFGLDGAGGVAGGDEQVRAVSTKPEGPQTKIAGFACGEKARGGQDGGVQAAPCSAAAPAGPVRVMRRRAGGTASACRGR